MSKSSNQNFAGVEFDKVNCTGCLRPIIWADYRRGLDDYRVALDPTPPVYVVKRALIEAQVVTVHVRPRAFFENRGKVQCAAMIEHQSICEPPAKICDLPPAAWRPLWQIEENGDAIKVIPADECKLCGEPIIWSQPYGITGDPLPLDPSRPIFIVERALCTEGARAVPAAEFLAARDLKNYALAVLHQSTCKVYHQQQRDRARKAKQ